MISVIIPVLNEEETIGSVVTYCRQFPAVSEVLVVDDKSVDQTVKEAEKAGARVITSLQLGKGASMRDGIREATGEIVLFLDGDIDPYPPEMVTRLTRPIIDGEADFVKATFDRNAGRVTELVAKPLLSILFPELAHYHQPLSGMIAGRKSFLQRAEFINDYGVDIGLLIDMFLMQARIVEVNIGYIENKSKPWQMLGKMSKEVANAIVSRALAHNKPAINLGELETISVISQQMELALKNNATGLPKMVIFDMDNTILQGRFIDECAATYLFDEQLRQLRQNETDPILLTKRIASILKGLSIGELLKVATSIPLVPDVEEVVRQLKARGYLVGIISDSYQVVVNYIKGKIGADFGLANQLEYYNGKVTGEITIPSFFYNHATSLCRHRICKTNAMQHISQSYQVKPENCIAVGDSANDRCMIEHAGIGVAFCTKDPILRQKADKLIEEAGFMPLLEFAD